MAKIIKAGDKFEKRRKEIRREKQEKRIGKKLATQAAKRSLPQPANRNFNVSEEKGLKRAKKIINRVVDKQIKK